VMGLGASRFWWPQGFTAALISRNFHVVTFDLRDGGESTHLDTAGGGNPIAAQFRRASTAYTAEDMTDDAIAVLDAIGWESAHVYGQSLGGVLAQRIAIRHPGRVRSLTSCAALPSDATGISGLRYVRPGFLARMALMRFPEGRDGDIAFGLAVYRAIAAPGYPLDETTARECIDRDLAHGGLSFRDASAQTRQNTATWHGGRLSGLRLPALVMHGHDDQVLRPAAARRTAAAINGARLRIFPIYTATTRCLTGLQAAVRLSSYLPRAPSASSRRMSRWPLCRAVSSVRWNKIQRSVTGSARQPRAPWDGASRSRDATRSRCRSQTARYSARS